MSSILISLFLIQITPVARSRADVVFVLALILRIINVVLKASHGHINDVLRANYFGVEANETALLELTRTATETKVINLVVLRSTFVFPQDT